MTDQDRIVAPSRQSGEIDRALRPENFSTFVGQEAAKANLKVFVEAARNRNDALDHVLLFRDVHVRVLQLLLGVRALEQVVEAPLGGRG